MANSNISSAFCRSKAMPAHPASTIKNSFFSLSLSLFPYREREREDAVEYDYGSQFGVPRLWRECIHTPLVSLPDRFPRSLLASARGLPLVRPPVSLAEMTLTTRCISRQSLSLIAPCSVIPGQWQTLTECPSSAAPPWIRSAGCLHLLRGSCPLSHPPCPKSFAIRSTRQ